MGRGHQLNTAPESSCSTPVSAHPQHGLHPLLQDLEPSLGIQLHTQIPQGELLIQSEPRSLPQLRTSSKLLVLHKSPRPDIQRSHQDLLTEGSLQHGHFEGGAICPPKQGKPLLSCGLLPWKWSSTLEVPGDKGSTSTALLTKPYLHPGLQSPLCPLGVLPSDTGGV